MAVLVEAISVITRADSVKGMMAGGIRAFLRLVPNETFCYDGELFRVGFMDPRHVEQFISELSAKGLIFLKGGRAVDIAVVDQLQGPTTTVPWLEYGRFPIGGDPEKNVALCWLFEGRRKGAGIHFKGDSMKAVMPEGWVYENSLSARCHFIPT